MVVEFRRASRYLISVPVRHEHENYPNTTGRTLVKYLSVEPHLVVLSIP